MKIPSNKHDSACKTLIVKGFGVCQIFLNSPERENYRNLIGL